MSGYLVEWEFWRDATCGAVAKAISRSYAPPNGDIVVVVRDLCGGFSTD